MRILIVHNRYRSGAPSGENRVVEEEAALLRRSGHQLLMFGESSDSIEEMSHLERALTPARVIWSDASRRRLRGVLRSFRPDVAHVHNTFPLASASVLAACRQENVPVVATVHNYRLVCAGGTLFRDGRVCHECLPERQGSVWPGIRHGCYRGSSLATVPIAASILVNDRRWRTAVGAYLMLSGAEADIFRRSGFPAERVFVKPNFVTDRPTVDGERGQHVLYLGRLAHEKGIVVLQRAWERLVASGRANRPLLIAGGGPLEDEVAAWAARTPDVEFLGHKSPAECAALTRRALAAVVPSSWEETFGLVVVEAMAAGVPSVAARHASFPDLIDDGTTGLLFKPGDAGDLAAQLGQLLDDPLRATQLGMQARVAYESRFTPEANLDLLLDAYHYAIDHPLP